jgi:TetR/AcrR family transcriptional regulator, transcriptional repressor for nem operon
MARRSELKQDSLKRILEAGSARLRLEGLTGAAIAPVMKDAGLTHGAFYAHFHDKETLAEAAFRHAFAKGRPKWIGTARDVSWSARLTRLARRYLRPRHRDERANSCAFSALGADAARAPDTFRRAYAEEFCKSIEAICGAPVQGPGAAQRYDDAIFLMAVCVGGLTLSRAVADRPLSDRILSVCRKAVTTLSESPVRQDETSTRGGSG